MEIEIRDDKDASDESLRRLLVDQGSSAEPGSTSLQPAKDALYPERNRQNHATMKEKDPKIPKPLLTKIMQPLTAYRFLDVYSHIKGLPSAFRVPSHPPTGYLYFNARVRSS